MTARAYHVHGVELVNCGADLCSACDRKAVGTTISGHLVCARHAGMAAQLADEYAQERDDASERREQRTRPALERAKAKCEAEEAVKGDRQRGRNGGAARKNNANRPASPRAERDRRRYLADPDKKIAQVKARQAVLRRAQP